MEKYSGYKAADFLDDEYFIQWLIKPDNEQELFWSSFIKKYPSQRAEVDKARLIFGMLQAEQERLSLDETYGIWNGVLEATKKKTASTWVRVLKYAAVLVLIFMSGALSFYIYQINQQTHFDLSELEQQTDEAKIILSDGTEFSLEQKESMITHNSDGNQLVVNNDTIAQTQYRDREAMNKVIIPYGKKSMIVLSDGTKVWLNAGSQFIYPSSFLRKKREVVLIGEAYFDVAKNLEKPFIVRTSDIHVKVLGTKFDVSAYPEDPIIETILEEGSVSLEIMSKGLLGRSEEILLKPNQRVSLNKESGETKIREVDVSMYTSWKDGMLKSEKEDLARLIKKVERYYNIDIRIKDPLVGGFKISGKLDLKNNPEQTLNIIKLTVPIDWSKKSNGDFIIVKR